MMKLFSFLLILILIMVTRVGLPIFIALKFGVLWGIFTAIMFLGLGITSKK